jgi:hypothetical protein
VNVKKLDYTILSKMLGYFIQSACFHQIDKSKKKGCEPFHSIIRIFFSLVSTKNH